MICYACEMFLVYSIQGVFFKNVTALITTESQTEIYGSFITTFTFYEGNSHASKIIL